VSKNDREVVEILEAYDLTRSFHAAAELVGCDPKTVARYVALRDGGADPFARTARVKSIDPYLEKLEELVERSKGRIRADVAHQKIAAMGFAGSERTSRRAVARAKSAYEKGNLRTYRPWITEPGMWLQFDWGEGPRIGPRRTYLFCAWLAWSRFRVVIPVWDLSLGGLVACLDETLRRVGGAPTYLLTDNPKTVTVEHIAGVPVRHPQVVAAGRHYGCQVLTCVPYDPESKGGAEASVRIAKADLVPTGANLRPAYESFSQVAEACDRWCDQVNARVHKETAARPADRLTLERPRLHRLPEDPHTAALGESRLVGDDQTVRFGGTRYSVPRQLVREQVWCRIVGEELAVYARHDGHGGIREAWRHRVSTPGNPVILDEHYDGHPAGRSILEPVIRPRSQAEAAFTALGPGAERWLREAAALGTARMRRKMAQAVDLSHVVGGEAVDQALGLAAIAGRFGDGDLVSILDHLAAGTGAAGVVRADEAHSAQPGTAGWAEYGR
jgi:transposase